MQIILETTVRSQGSWFSFSLSFLFFLPYVCFNETRAFIFGSTVQYALASGAAISGGVFFFFSLPSYQNVTFQVSL